MNIREGLKQAKRVVVKVGTSTITRPSGGANLARMEELVRELAGLKDEGREMILVTSGEEWAGAGKCYNDCDILQPVLGRLYTWNEATGGEEGSGLAGGPQGVCPEGWSIPTAEDWENLGKALNKDVAVPFLSNWAGLGQKLTVEAYLNGVKMWPISPDNNKSNTVNWNAIPAGYNLRSGEIYRDIMNYGMWWSSARRNADRAYYRYIYFDADYCGVNYASIDDAAFSVRCVKRIGGLDPLPIPGAVDEQ